MDEKGKHVLDKKGQRVKDYCQRISPNAGSDANELRAAHLRAGVAECAKYTLKTDEASLSQFSDAFLYDLIETKHRYYGRFGCLHARTESSKQFKELNRLNSDFKDLERVDAEHLRQMTNPETGEVFLKMNTSMVITNFRNVAARTAAVASLVGTAASVTEHYYSIKDMSKAVQYMHDAEAGVAKALSVTLYKAYSPENDIAASDDEAYAASLPAVSPGLEKCPPLQVRPKVKDSFKPLKSTFLKLKYAAVLYHFNKAVCSPAVLQLLEGSPRLPVYLRRAGRNCIAGAPASGVLVGIPYRPKAGAAPC